MSNAKEIYSGGSSFAKVAAYIGLGREPMLYYKYFGYSTIQRRIQGNTNSMQQSFSYFFLFHLGYVLGRLSNELFNWWFKAWSCNKQNELAKLGVVLYNIICGRYSDAENFLVENPIRKHFFDKYYRRCFFCKRFDYRNLALQLEKLKRFPNIYKLISETLSISI